MNRNKKKSVCRSVAACVLSVAMLLTGGCGRNNGNASQDGGTIYVIAKQQLSFWDDVRTGAEDAGKELGYDIVYKVAEGDNDYASQVQFIQNAIRDKAKAIVIAPNSTTDLNETLQKAVDANIKVISINSDIQQDSMNPISLSLVNSSDRNCGVSAARNAAKGWRDKGKNLDEIGNVAIIGHTASTAEQRIEGFVDTLKRSIGNANHVTFPDYNPFAAMMGGGDAAAYGGGDDAAAYGGGDTAATGAEGQEGDAELTDEERAALEEAEINEAVDERIRKEIEKKFIIGEQCSKREDAKAEARNLITSNDNISIMFGTNTVTTLGICDAINELGMSGKILVVGFNSDEEELTYIRTGVLYGVVVQNPYVMGYVGVKFASNAISGTQVSHHLDTGVTFVTANNMNDEFVQLVLHPNAADN
ncbi:substrate-binding domain-containing protein [Ruminococcus sp.]|uniref:substrate-binding domain-containing protein n=1 Tax=Ruminococcus sp. TaxID=41978 RepID=UPI001B54DDF4|nr:substrate-binding domain-containing protein [Ruminococcus sp.]MBP5434033.1 substrate-binding domain-containing protein [Ruminococcus sp.]